MTRDRVLRYLQLLDEEDPDRLRVGLRRLLRSEPDLCWRPGDQAGEVSLGPYGSLDLHANGDSFRRRFLRWWGDRLGERGRRPVDALTDLHTRSAWEESLKPSLTDGWWIVVLGDIDHFKRFNDRHGHGMGDRVLEAVGRTALDHFHEGDHLVRYGGEELLFVLTPDTEPRRRAEAFRRRLEAGGLFANQPESVTLSLGLAEKKREEPFDDALRRADRALYVSKDRGRNRLTRYAPYMDHLRSLSIWGFYRYLWDRNVRFSLGSDARGFLLALADELVYYAWRSNAAETFPVPGDLRGPLRSVVGSREGFVLLDAEGALWRWTLDEGHRPLSPEAPAMACLVGGDEARWGVGVNNQLYRLDPGGAKRVGSLPSRWDYVAGDSDVRVVRDDRVCRASDGETLAELPEPPRQVTMSGETFILVGFEGGLYALEPDTGRWQQYRLPRLDGRPVFCREVSVRGSRVLLRDGQGRLLLTDRRTKAVPQAMDLNLKTGVGP